MPAKTAAKKKSLFHAAIQVTRVEEWCIEAESAEEARRLLECGDGHRCTPGERLHLEVLEMLE